jgi:hypothetical protein
MRNARMIIRYKKNECGLDIVGFGGAEGEGGVSPIMY